MPYFIRRYQTGIKNSGTKDLIVSDVEIPLETFINLAHATGPGKYMLGQRGKGIRGFRKITNCMVEEEFEEPIHNTYDTFNAEDSISVKKNMRLSEMSDAEITDLMSTMETAEIQSDDEFGKFRKDLSALNREIRRRMIAPSEGLAAENAFTGDSIREMPVASTMFSVSPMTAGAIGAVVGGLAGTLGTAMYYRSKIDSLASEIDGFSQKLAEAEVAIKRAEEQRNADVAQQQAVNQFDASKAFDAELLSNYQHRNKPLY